MYGRGDKQEWIKTK